jgi:hypothetical protein
VRLVPTLHRVKDDVLLQYTVFPKRSFALGYSGSLRGKVESMGHCRSFVA